MMFDFTQLDALSVKFDLGVFAAKVDERGAFGAVSY